VQMANVGSVTRAGDPAEPTKLNESDMLRLEAALNQLGTVDARLVEHLETLAKISKEKPVKFKSLLTILETM